MQRTFDNLYEKSPPEISRVNLSPLILHLKSLGIDNIYKFPFFTKPENDNLVKSLELLYSMNIIDMDCNLTPELGLQMYKFPLDSKLIVTLIESSKFSSILKVFS